MTGRKRNSCALYCTILALAMYFAANCGRRHKQSPLLKCDVTHSYGVCMSLFIFLLVSSSAVACSFEMILDGCGADLSRLCLLVILQLVSMVFVCIVLSLLPVAMLAVLVACFVLWLVVQVETVFCFQHMLCC